MKIRSGRREPPGWLETCRLIREDYERYIAIGGEGASRLGVILFTQGLWASAVYRMNRFLYLSFNGPLVGLIVKSWLVVSRKIIEILTGICLHPQSEIGGGLYIGHYGPIIIHPRARIGEHCNLSQGVTVGEVQAGERKGVPVIGDRVYIGPNAVVIGNITIGNDAAIGAGSVVVRSVPPRAVVVGNPARVVSFKGSFDLVRFRGMDSDPERIAALDEST